MILRNKQTYYIPNIYQYSSSDDAYLWALAVAPDIGAGSASACLALHSKLKRNQLSKEYMYVTFKSTELTQ